MQNNNEPTNYEILEAINDFATKVDQRFVKIDQRFEKIEERLENIELSLAEIHQEMERIRLRLDSLEKKWFEESTAFAGEILDLRRRVDVLEAQIKRYQSAS